MASRIRLLPENVANQIAAGEVVERPASVVKELVENALDSGATQIDLRTRGGGRSLIEVVDDGCGMGRDDALLSLERHATSKLRETEDLRHLVSYGFRGEALPSIASVSRFALRTREADSVSGTEILIDGGKITTVRDAGLAVGTQVEVRSLFYNLPARRKFLRTEATELAHVSHQMMLAGLSRPEVGFQITHGEATPLRWPSGQDLARRIAAMLGESWLQNLVPIAGQEEDLRLSGFIGQPGLSRSNRQEQFIFVNRRPVENRTIHYGLLEGYHNSLMKGRYPVAVLFLEINPEGVDVNIHPAKREIRFHDDARVRHFLVRAVQASLQGFSTAPISVTFASPLPTPPFTSVAQVTPDEHRPQTGFWAVAESTVAPAVPASSIFALPSPPSDHPKSTPRSGENPTVVAASPSHTAKPAGTLELRFVGVVARLYILAESRDGLVLIDQHAAHERILFEKVLRHLALQEVTTQRLLIPVTVKLPPREAQFLREQLESLQRIGLEISTFGGETFLIDGLPPLVKWRNVEEFICDLVVDLQAEGGETRKQRRLSEETVAKKACRLAVKANDLLAPGECEGLLRDLLRCDLPYTCPHGRPTMILFSRAELEKKFGRTGA